MIILLCSLFLCPQQALSEAGWTRTRPEFVHFAHAGRVQIQTDDKHARGTPTKAGYNERYNAASQCVQSATGHWSGQNVRQKTHQQADHVHNSWRQRVLGMDRLIFKVIFHHLFRVSIIMYNIMYRVFLKLNMLRTSVPYVWGVNFKIVFSSLQILIFEYIPNKYPHESWYFSQFSHCNEIWWYNFYTCSMLSTISGVKCVTTKIKQMRCDLHWFVRGLHKKKKVK